MAAKIKAFFGVRPILADVAITPFRIPSVAGAPKERQRREACLCVLRIVAPMVILVDKIMHGLVFHIRQEPRLAAERPRDAAADRIYIAVRWQFLPCRFVIVSSEHKLPNTVYAVGPSRRFARCLNGRQKECDQDSDDSDHHEQLDEGEAK